jgi:hypothetical protein
MFLSVEAPAAMDWPSLQLAVKPRQENSYQYYKTCYYRDQLEKTRLLQ